MTRSAHGRISRVYDHPAVLHSVLEMERNGILLDTELCATIAGQATSDEAASLTALRSWARDAGWFGDDAPDELVDDIWASSTVGLPAFLHTELGLNLKPSPIKAKGRVKDGEISTDHAALDFLASHNPDHRANLNRIIRLRQERSAVKYTTTFPTFIQPDGLVHPVFGAADSDGGDGGTVSGRLSIKKPPFAQWPRNAEKDHYQLRRLLVAPDGEDVVAVDAEAGEVVLLADYLIWRLDDDRLASRLSEPVDIHSQTTAALFPEMGLTGADVARAKGADAWSVEWGPKPQRPRGQYWAGDWEPTDIPTALVTLRDKVAKVTRYSLHYGKGDWGLGNTMVTAAGDPIGEEEAHKLIEQFLDDEPWLRTYMDEVWWRLSRFGGITALDGNALDTRTLWAAGGWGRRAAWRKGLNYPMQRGLAFIINLWMFLVATNPVIRAMGGLLRMQMHDELVLTAPHGASHDVMEEVRADLDKACEQAGLLVKLKSKGGVGPTWYDAK